MKKKGIVLLVIVSFVSLFFFLNKNFSDNLYDLLEESHQFSLIECDELKIIKNILLVPFSSSEKQVRLKSDYTLEKQSPTSRDIMIQILENSQEKKSEGLYQFGSQNIKFRVSALNAMGFNMKATPKLLELRLNEKQIRYDSQWFELAQDMLLSETDEALFVQSLPIKLKDIKAENNVQALYNAILYESLRNAFGISKEPVVMYEGNNSLYVFSEFTGPEKVSLEWILFKNKDYYCSGSMSYICNHDYKKGFFTEAISYLKTILWQEIE